MSNITDLYLYDPVKGFPLYIWKGEIAYRMLAWEDRGLELCHLIRLIQCKKLTWLLLFTEAGPMCNNLTAWFEEKDEEEDAKKRLDFWSSEKH